MKLDRKWRYGGIIFLAAVILIVALFASSCVGGLTPIGWSGGTVSGGTLFVSSTEGRLVAIDLADESRQWSDPLKVTPQTGLFGCSPVTGGAGCGGAMSVAIYGTPVVSGELVYIAGYNGKVYAYNSDSLAVRWVYPRESNLEPIVGGLAMADDKLFFGCSDGYVYSLDTVTGDKLWEYPTEDKIWGTPAVSGDTVFIGSFDKKLHAIDINTGNTPDTQIYSFYQAIFSYSFVGILRTCRCETAGWRHNSR